MSVGFEVGQQQAGPFDVFLSRPKRIEEKHEGCWFVRKWRVSNACIALVSCAALLFETVVPAHSACNCGWLVCSNPGNKSRVGGVSRLSVSSRRDNAPGGGQVCAQFLV